MTHRPHDARIRDLVSRLTETADRFRSRVEGAGARAEQAASGWTAAQIAVHVAMVNRNLAGVIDGTLPAAAPPAPDFVERPWVDLVKDVPERNEAPARFLPPDGVNAADALAQFQESVSHLKRALESLSPERARYCITNRTVGTMSLYQTGEFAIAHMIRHNQQAKRVLGG